MAMVLRYINVALGYIQTIQITDIIDMAIIAFIFYRLLLLSRKSHSGQVIKGVLLLVVAMWVTYQFRLHAMSFILSAVFEIGFLALVIVFQPEIRRFLEQMGSRGISQLFGRQAKTSNLEHAIQETVDAFSSLSRDHIGALVVFERNSILDECIKSGTMVDAELSSELLKNIFWPKAPLHDGAVVVRDSRILSAGCVLPLTGNLNVSRELGTRHRAGIGISENSDAVVAIVSEETGAISVAVGGMLKRHLSVDTLERLLRNELIPAEDASEHKRTLWGLFSRKKGGEQDVD